MPVPSRRKGEKRSAYVSRCISEMSKKDPGRSKDQLVAMCQSKANQQLSDSEIDALASLFTEAVKEVKDLNPPMKKKKRDKYRITKEDGSGTDDTAASNCGDKKKKKSRSCVSCAELLEDDCGSVELYALAAEKKKSPKPLGKPFRTPGGPKKFSVYVKNDKGNIVKVNFGDPNMEIKRDDPGRRKNFRARHNCDNPGPKWKARYWSCRMWEKGKPVSKVASAHVCNTSYVNGHIHRIPHGVDSGETSYDHGHTHPFKRNPDGSYTIGNVDGHIHEVKMSSSSGKFKKVE